MPPSPSSGELWGHHLMPAQVEVSFFMPNGLFILMKIRRDASLQSIKHELWREARSYPLHNLLMEPHLYIFVGVTQDGEREEFYDEMRRLCDLRLFQPILKLIEPAGNKDEKMFNSKLNFMIGMTLSEFDESENLELITFRRSVLSYCKRVIDEKNARGIEGKALYHYPPNIYPTPQLPHHIMEILKRDQCKVLVTVWVETSSNNRSKFTVKVRYNADVSAVISNTIRRKIRSESILQEDQEVVIVARAANCLLKVCGYEEYLLGNYPICQYKYIRQSISMGRMPHLMIVDRKKVFSILNTKSDFTMPSYIQKGVDALQSILSQPTIHVWNIEKKLKIKINFVSFVNVKERGEFFVRAGLYQGTEPLCQNQSTRNVESTNPKWYQWIEFDILLKELPRTAKLCLSLCCSLPKKSRKKVEYAMSWCNINLFDFCNRFVSGVLNLRMWSSPPGFEDLLNPSGTSGSNPCMDNPNIQLEFEQLCKSSSSVTFPKQDEILKEALTIEKSNPPIQKFKQSDIAAVQDIITKDSLSELSEQDKEFLWKMRQYCKGTPNSLPKLLRAVKWNFRDDVAILYSMLPNWHMINVESALELLYCYCTDTNVRQFAVKCLDDRLSDSQLSQYLLQLVQALEYESYMDNALVQFLLKKALNNEHIGQSFFWYLKAIMSYSPKRAYFALILEAYLRTCDNLSTLMQQVKAIEKLTKLSEKLKTEKEDVQIKSLRSQLQSPDYLEVLQNFPSPLDRRFILGELVIDQCDVKSSKKRPLLLTWKNPDVMSAISVPEFQIIFKIGDDLRQDMLTLQMFAIMDNIWQSEGLDLRMIPYGCLATGLNSGLIEVVRNAKTVTQILNKDFRSRELHNWIKEKNKPEVKDGREKCPYTQAIEAFTKSCAGYCVATFVLGIGDRHPSNIMVTEGGQVFHIDFGHFLDHRKKKFGINRERVPFVLTEDFIQVVARGQDNPEKSKEFRQFMELCGKAYLSLRKHANGFITLFTMMLSCGIPELQSLDDINYIRKTLMVDCRNHEEAFKYFQQQFHEAYGGAWTTKADWFFHWIKSLT